MHNMNTLNNITLRFPHATLYRYGSQNTSVQERPPQFRPFPYRERHLQCLWTDPRHRPQDLKTTGCEPIEIVHAGDWNFEAGPDFLNAVLLVGKEKRRICGDLEIHIHANAWKQHGHAGDARYENVCFHVVYFPGEEIPGLLQIPLYKSLSSDPTFSFENIDPTAYPYSIPAGNFPLKNLHPDRKIELLESAGEERLRLKAERLALTMQTKDAEQVLWEELMAALGYKNNKTPFRRMASDLSMLRLRSLAHTPDEAYALLLGFSGLLPPNPDPSWPSETRNFIRSVWDFWWKQSEDLKDLALQKSAWTLTGIRPANHPVRRLMAAAHYAFQLTELAHNDSALTGFPNNFWNTHISWKKKCTPTALVGQARANAIITNILIPFKAATGTAGLNLKELPVEPMNSIIRQTAHTLFGPDHTHKVYRSALARQGLIQIFHDYLIPHRLDELQTKFGGTLSKRNGGTTSPESKQADREHCPRCPHPNGLHIPRKQANSN